MNRRDPDSMVMTSQATVRREGRAKTLLREYAEAILPAIILFLVIRTFLFQAFRIPSASMEDTLAIGDFLFVNKFLYGAKVPFLEVRLPGIRDPKPGDIIVFKYPRDTRKDYIKRCIAVEGQTVEIRDKRVYVDGVLREEPFTKHTDPLTRPGDIRDYLGPVVVPPGHLFMMGDNRDNSSDSRYWEFLDRDLIKGKALFIYWSWDTSHRLLGFVPTPRLERIGDLIR
ncbi:MAG TPA: signal peptidase I [Candidatus Udaeobacter sp.]|nr:signal peptidase I [Candidatus Udaeobacter sp.]